jgi:hypothetical protein
MRGNIIQYNGQQGKGLISANARQYVFDIGQWRSDSAPAVNQTVEIELTDDEVLTVARIGDDTLRKEKAEELVGKLGPAVQALKTAAATGRSGNVLDRIGKPLIVAYALFAVGALCFSFLTVHMPFGDASGFSLIELSRLSAQLGASVGGSTWAWLGISSIAVPAFVGVRWAWLSLLLPLWATVKPVIDMAGAMQQASSAIGSFGGNMGSEMAHQMMSLIHPGFGGVLCAASALYIAAQGIKRVRLAPAARHA